MKFFTTVEYGPQETLIPRLRAALDAYKVVHLRGVPDPVQLEPFYFELGHAVGHFLFKNENPVTAELDSDGWLDTRYDPALADLYKYRHGNERMSLHMDGVYSDVHFDLIFLFCTQAAEIGGATTFIDGPDVIQYLEKYDRAFLDEVLRTPVLFEKGVKSKRSPLIFFEGGLPAFNWNHTRVAESNPPHVKALAARFHQFCEERLVGGGLLTPCRLERGEAVFVHNRLVLHGRNSFWGDRCLMKGAIALRAPANADRTVREGRL